MKIFGINKLSWKIAAIILVFVLAVGISVAIYLELLLVKEINDRSKFMLHHEISNAALDNVGESIDADKVVKIADNVKVFDTGFALVEDSRGEFINDSKHTSRLTGDEKGALKKTARENPDEVFEISIGGTDYLAAHEHFSKDFVFYVLAPKSEVYAESAALLLRLLATFPFVLIIVLLISVRIGKAFSKPLVALADFMNKAGTTGDITIRPQDTEIVAKYSQVDDEIGECIRSSASFVKRMVETSKGLEAVAGGDLTFELQVLSDRDVMGHSLSKMADNLNNMLTEINALAGQVSTSSKHISDGAQSLSQGSMKQAASVHELSSSISVIAEKTRSNESIADQAANLARTIKENAEKGSRQMDEMIMAVNEINEASGSINKVIKVIDDIAFQTNILALNAAVEAARAGQNGKGFAVVADEVRNLAAKSTAAAKDTSALIENSFDKANLGVRIAAETAESLAKIVDGINESALLVEEIAKSSEEQSASITQINHGIEQVTEIVQQNSSTAEESAAASGEMNEQADTLRQLISQFVLKTDNNSEYDGY